MTPTDDWQLIDDYCATCSHVAFDQIVRRHAGWVYATALRRTRSPDLADDVTQATFIVLARKASMVGSKQSLAAWLYRVATYTATDALRRRGARQRHERLAARPEAIEERNTDPDSDDRETIAHLDTALDNLGRRDREAIILRYFNDQSLTDIARVQRVAASTVQRRIARSLGRIGNHLKRHGIAAAPAALPATLMAIGKLTAPASATQGLTALATAAGSLSIHTAGPIGLANGAIKTMAMIKIKIAAAATVAFILLGTGGAVATRYAIAREGFASPKTPASSNAVPANPSTLPRATLATAPSAAPSEIDVAKQITAKWGLVDLHAAVRNAPEHPVLEHAMLTIITSVQINDPTHILGFSNAGLHVTRVTDDAGHDVTAKVTAKNEDPPLRYVPLFSRKQEVRNRMVDYVDPISFSAALNIYNDAPDAADFEGYLTALTYESTTEVDVPFVAKGPPVELWPGVSIRFSKITQDGDSYMYAPDISATNHPLFDGQIQPGGLPKQVIANRFWIDASGKPLTDQPPMMGRFITESENGGFGQFGAPARPAALRFVIARGIHERQIPIALKQVALPHFGAFPNEPQGGEK